MFEKTRVAKYFSTDEMVLDLAVQIVKEEPSGERVGIKANDNICPLDFIQDTLWESVQVKTALLPLWIDNHQ